MKPVWLVPPGTPSTLQVTPVFAEPVTTAVYCAEAPSMRDAGPLSASITEGPPPEGGTGASRVTARLCETAEFARLVAVIVTAFDEGAVVGAVYRPAPSMRPTPALPPTTPLTLHETPALELPLMLAAYWALLPRVTVAGPVRVRATVGPPLWLEEGGGTVSVTGRLCEMAGFATLVAVMVTDPVFGAAAGAI
jgi:hypothetical protein